MRDKRLDHRREKLFQTDYKLKKTRGQNTSFYTEYYNYVKNSGKIIFNQPCLEFISRYSSEGRRLGTEKILPTSLIGDAKSEIAKGDWERG